MNSGAWILGACALVISFLLTLLLERAAGVTGLIDVPNERSSHVAPTPRGGGLAIVTASLVVMALMVGDGICSGRLFVALAGGGAAVATVGLIDDRRPLSPRVRLLVHFVAASWAVGWVSGTGFLGMAPPAFWLGASGFASRVVAIVWFLNIFNFMDGVDGIAASEAVFICGGIALLACLPGGAVGVAPTAVGIGAAATGFLPRNWPKAGIFMGDVGSGYLGFVIATLGLAYGVAKPGGAWAWLSLAGVFAADSTVTLVRRFMRGDALAVAHRTHAYQRLARRLGHLKVTTLVILVNLVWLLPCALLGTLRPHDGPWITVVALCPIALVSIGLGAGQPEDDRAAAR